MWFWALIVILPGLGLVGCQGEEVVTVSGAVERPGDYAFWHGWGVQDYLGASGGYLPEADVEGARLHRTQRDSMARHTSDYARVSRWPLDRVSGVMPGDRIVVPFRTYAVFLDTVRAVKDILLAWKGRVYGVPEGVVVPGWTKRGVMSAVLIGDGEVTREGGEESPGRFHYLYLRMHPDVYDRVLPDVGEAVLDREMLEDAVEVHRSLFEKSAYRSGINTKMPPEGYLRVQAGVWPAPKSRSFPGPGMRKRRYPDGREWTTFSDGRHRTKYPDGKVVVEFPDSTRETRYPDGRMVYRDAWDNVQTRYPDGREVWEMASGNRMTVYTDGKRVHRDTSGTVRTVLPDGVEQTAFSDGARHVRHPDGRVEVRTSAGARETRYPDGRVAAVTAEGHRVTVYPDGRQFTQMVDGRTIEKFPDGRLVQRNPTGEMLDISPGGDRRTVYRDGSETVRRPDGSRVVRTAGGTVMEEFPDGRRVQTDAAGNRLEEYPAGRRVQTDAAGNRVETLPDGTRRKTLADPYRYRGAVREDLVAIEQGPGHLSPGVETLLSGAVSDSVRNMSFEVFLLPDGDVVDVSVRIRDGRFRSRLKIDEPGYYRFQGFVGLSGLRIVIAEDRMLKVGDPPPLSAPTLEIPPFPGPEAGVRLLAGLINRARQRLGRQPLLEDVRLSRVAQKHLQEMLARGYFSTRSPVTGTVDRRLARHGIRFRSVTQNQSHAPSIEEAHEQLMLSAKTRREILNARWTHLGVAVTREQGEVWVVEVFVLR